MRTVCYSDGPHVVARILEARCKLLITPLHISNARRASGGREPV